jgi:hypothetical protein
LLLGSWDNYYAPSNYYLYNSGRLGAGDDFMGSPYFTFIPWDYDNCLGIDYFGTKWRYWRGALGRAPGRARGVAAQHGQAAPEWTEMRVLQRPWFSAELEIRRADALVWAPAAFRKHSDDLPAAVAGHHED